MRQGRTPTYFAPATYGAIAASAISMMPAAAEGHHGLCVMDERDVRRPAGTDSPIAGHDGA